MSDLNKAVYHQVDGFLNEVPDNVFHGFFGREGGYSEGVYKGLNCGFGSSDDKETIQCNRTLVAGVAGVPTGQLLNLHQTHSADCLIVEGPWVVKKPKADALVTKISGLALGILTADCAPVLFCGEDKNGASVIGAAHAGWGGALGGILGATVNAMHSLDVDIESIRACIGPCIVKASYEVGTEFTDPFISEDEENERFFGAGREEGKLQFDLAGYCAFKLSKVGLKHVFISDMDTYANEEQFFSYRRATHHNDPDYGRQMSVISLKE